MGKDEIAYLGTDTVYEGKLTFRGTVRIEGQYTGEISSEGTLNIGKDAKVEGSINVGELLLSGQFVGDITAQRRVVVYASGMLEGNVRTPILLTEEGGIVNGQVTMPTPGRGQQG